MGCNGFCISLSTHVLLIEYSLPHQQVFVIRLNICENVVFHISGTFMSHVLHVIIVLPWWQDKSLKNKGWRSIEHFCIPQLFEYLMEVISNAV